MLSERGSEETLISKFRPVFTHPLAVGALATAAVFGAGKNLAAEEVAANTAREVMACGLRTSAGKPALIVDEIGKKGPDSKDKAYVPGPGFNVRLNGSEPISYKDRIYEEAAYPDNGGYYYAAFDAKLEKTGELPFPSFPIYQILGDHGIAAGADDTMFQLTDEGFVQKGKTNISGSRVSYGGYHFYTNFRVTGGSTNENDLNIISDEDVINNTNPNGKIPETTKIVDNVSSLVSFPNDPAIDSTVSPAVVLIPTQRASDGQPGYIEFRTSELVDGHLPPPEQWDATTTFVPTGYKISQIYVDGKSGDRFLLSDEGDINIEGFDGVNHTIPNDMFPNGIKQLLIVDGALGVIGNGSTKPMFIRRTTDPELETIPGTPFAIYESKDFAGDGLLGEIQGCTTVAAPADLCLNAEVDDGNNCTIDTCDSSTGEVIHTYVVTNDNDGCTIDGCDPTTGEITHTGIPKTDNNACTVDDCEDGIISHLTVDTEDDLECTVGSCDPATGVITQTVTVGASCDGTGLCGEDGACNPQVQPEPTPDVVEAVDPDVVEGVDASETEGVDVNADPGSPDETSNEPTPEVTTPDETSESNPEVSTDVVPDEFADLTPDELQEAFDNLQADDGTTPPDATPDETQPDTNKPDQSAEGSDIAGSDKGPNDPDVTEVKGETTNTPDNSVETGGGGGSCTVGGIGTKAQIEALFVLLGLTGLLTRRRNKTAQN